MDVARKLQKLAGVNFVLNPVQFVVKSKCVSREVYANVLQTDRPLVVELWMIHLATVTV